MKRFAPLLALPALLAGCSGDSTSPQVEASVFGLLSDPVNLQVGAVATLRAGEAASVALDGANGAEYLYVPFFASDDGTARLALEIEGANVLAPTGPPNPALAPGGTAFSLTPSAAADPGEAFHSRLRLRERRELGPRIDAARAAAPAAGLQRSTGVQAQQSPAVPSVGQTITLNVPDVIRPGTQSLCTDPLVRSATVQAVSDRAIVVTDNANPASGITRAEFQAIAEQFDDLVYPVDVRNFGEPTDIDDNGRSILFYTRVVNELTAPGATSFVGGFFFAGDLFPPSACPASNFAEIFYLLAPDATGAIRGIPRTEEEIFQNTVGTTGHEFQHLINAGRRIYINDADDFEEAWLNEGLSHIAEELIFFEASGLQPRQNIDVDALVASQEILDAFNSYGIDNFGRLFTYLEDPDTASLLGIDNLQTRGASWAFLRYAADREPGPDQQFFFRLVNATTSGVVSLNAILGVDVLDWMQDWTVSVYTDDTSIPVEPRFTQPSWNFRDIMAALARDERYPLAVRRLGADAKETFDLRGGGAAFVRFGIPAGSRAVLSTTSGGGIPPSGVRISVVRVR